MSFLEFIGSTLAIILVCGIVAITISESFGLIDRLIEWLFTDEN